MTTHVGRPSRLQKPRVPISTRELLTAVAELGPHWPARFGDYEIVDVNEALDREMISGHLLDAITLAPQGRQILLAAYELPAGVLPPPRVPPGADEST